MNRVEYRFSGFGGQGVITMCHVLGHAASIHAGMDSTMTEAYGPEKTGGFSRGDLVVSEEKIDYPNVVDPNVVVAFSQDAFERDADSVTQDGLVVVERDLVDPDRLREDRPDVTIVSIPAVELAEEIGLKVVANIVMLGAVAELVGTPDPDTVKEAVRANVPEGTEDLNERAFQKGREALDEAEIETTAGQLTEVQQ